MADALQRPIREALNKGSELAWGKLLSFIYWGLGYPGEPGGGGKSCNQRCLSLRLPNLWKAQIFRPRRTPRELRMGSVEGMELRRGK